MLADVRQHRVVHVDAGSLRLRLVRRRTAHPIPRLGAPPRLDVFGVALRVRLQPQEQIVGRHRCAIDPVQPRGFGSGDDRAQCAQTPGGIALAQIGVEGRIARRQCFAVDDEGAVQEQGKLGSDENFTILDRHAWIPAVFVGLVTVKIAPCMRLCLDRIRSALQGGGNSWDTSHLTPITQRVGRDLTNSSSVPGGTCAWDANEATPLRLTKLTGRDDGRTLGPSLVACW